MTVTSCLISISVVTGRTDRHHSLDNESPILLIGYGMFLSLSFMLEEIVLVIFSLVFCLHHVLSVWAGRVCESRWRARAGRCPAPSWSWRCWRCTQGPAWPRAARSAPCVPVSIHTHTHTTHAYRGPAGGRGWGAVHTIPHALTLKHKLHIHTRTNHNFISVFTRIARLLSDSIGVCD